MSASSWKLMVAGTSLLGAWMVAGCGSGTSSSPGGAAQTAGTLTYALHSKITTLDPGRVQDVNLGDVLQNVFEGLVTYDANNKIVPLLAEKWEVRDGGKTFLFKIKKGVKFHNGRELVAADFKWTWERNLGPKVASPVAGDYLAAIVGVKEFIDGKAGEISGVKAPDPSTLEVKLLSPRPYFLASLAHFSTFVLAKESAGLEQISDAKQAVGTGPYTLSAIVPDQQIELGAFEGYHGGAPAIKRILRPMMLDPVTRLQQYRAGRLDILTLDRRDVESIEADPALKPQLTFQNRPAVIYLLLNQKQYKPFADPRVRQAFALAIDRPRIVQDLVTGFGEAKGLIPEGVPGFQPNYPGISPNLDRAKALLAEAGYPDGKGLPPIELAYREGNADSRMVCEAVTTRLNEALGTNIRAQVSEWAALLKRRNEDKLEMGLMSWYGDYLDPQNFLSLLITSTSKMNHEGYANPKFDALCAKADMELDEARRLNLYQQAERIAVDEAARIPIYQPRDPVLVQSRVKRLESNLFGLLPHRKTTAN